LTADLEDNEEAKHIAKFFDEQIKELAQEEEQEIEKIKRGDELAPAF
jgi:flagellar motor component MotA